MSKTRKKFDKGIRLKEENLTTEALAKKGEVALDSVDDKLKYHDGTNTREVADTDSAQTLTTKTIDADSNTISNIETDNLKAGVLITDISTATADTELPSALAVKTALDGQNEASEIDYTPAVPGDYDVAPSKVKPALDELAGRVNVSEGDVSNHLADAVDAHDASAISNVASGNLAATDVQGALNELQSDVDTRALANLGTITNASIQTPSRSDVKQDTEANLITYASSASDGQLVFATDIKKMFQVVDNALEAVGGGGGTVIEIEQTAHGLSVGEGVYHNGSAWAKAKADADSTLASFVVTEVTDVNNFIAYQFGRVEVPSHGFTVGQFYFQSEATAGLATTTEPSSGFSNPLFYVESASFLQVMVYRPSAVGNNLSLDELSDVSTAGATNGQALSYNGSSWVPATVASSSADVSYDNSSSGLTATDAQAAIDETEARLDTAESSITTNASNLTTHESDTTTHGTTGDIVGTSDFQTITNKDIDGGAASNLNRVTVPKATKTSLEALTRKEATLVYATDKNELFIDDGTDLNRIGSDGIVNHIKNGKADDGLTGWTTFIDAAGVIPVDGEGAGAVNVLSVDATSKLRGENSFKYAKASGNKQGEGFSYDYLSENADSTLLQKVSFNLSVTSGYIDDEASVYCYNKTDSKLIYLSNSKIKSSTNSQEFIGYFYNPSGVTDLRFIIHIGGTDTAAWDMFVDEVSVSPVKENRSVNNDKLFIDARGCVATGLTSDVTPIPFTAITDSYNAWSGNTFTAPRDMTISYDGGVRLTSQPSAYDFAAFINGAIDVRASDVIQSTSNGRVHGILVLNKGDTFDLRIQGGSATTNNDTKIHYLKIQELVTATNESDTTGRQVHARYTSSNNQTVVNGGTIKFEELQSDSHGSYNSTTGVYTFPESGLYTIDSHINSNNESWSNAFVMGLTIVYDGVEFAQGNTYATGASSSPMAAQISETFQAIKGKEMFMRYNGNLTIDLNNAFRRNSLCITKVGELPNTVLPNFTKFQTKFLTADVTSNGDVSDLQFNNLTIGKTYQVAGIVSGYSTSGVDLIKLVAYSGASATGTKYGASWMGSSGASEVDMNSPNYIFTAVSTTLYFNAGSIGANSQIFGNGDMEETHITLIELPAHTEVDTF